MLHYSASWDDTRVLSARGSPWRLKFCVSSSRRPAADRCWWREVSTSATSPRKWGRKRVFPYKWLCLNTKYVKQFFCITWLMSLANGWTLNPHTSHWVFIYSDRCYCVIINQSYFISCLFHLLNNADVEMSSVFLQLADTEALSRPPEAKSE